MNHKINSKNIYTFQMIFSDLIESIETKSMNKISKHLFKH